MSHSAIKNLARMAVMLIAATLVVAGCPGNQPPPTASPTLPATAVATQTPTATPTAPPTPTEPPAMDTPTTAQTDTPTPTVQPPTPTPVPPTATPTPIPTETPTAAAQPQTARAANLRAGPGTNYAVVGSAAAQQAIEPTGRNEAGDWLEVQTADGNAWIAAFLVENAVTTGLPVHQSTAPTLTPVPQSPPPTASATVVPTAGSVACGTSLPAPQDLRYTDGAVTIIQAPPIGTASWTQKNLTWRWDGMEQVRGLDWYFDLQFMLGGQQGNPVLRTTPLDLDTPNEAGNWEIMAPLTNASGGVDPNQFKEICPQGEPRCPLHLRIQVALRDSSGSFACFISPPSNAVPVPLP